MRATLRILALALLIAPFVAPVSAQTPQPAASPSVDTEVVLEDLLEPVKSPDAEESCNGGSRAQVCVRPSRVKLLFDQNLSYRLVHQLAHLFPDSLHVRDVRLQAADDDQVWRYAEENGFAIVSKDADFHQHDEEASFLALD